ncbi:MAG: FprA family A-type flavoprotein [Bacilli bacterium]|jgi:flavorubredoxin|nr:FprA family A-type flavoprotein [Bacilli bacterium]MDD2681829.1 FprA family A-type flavoprotein [Bacilli bacterium]MDD3121381.1 FprA family A-type flavoprotein [Bacilli bacterium]MDD4063240.1 FprA family A-type flavoprotein [Bacilli bacterium]MDD4482588.1 FprA family A-type flavoprotein [Bacilli bacterium]
MQAYKINDSVYWVGAIDWQVRDVHGYSTERGTTYNAYLIIDDKITLIDNVKEQFASEMIQRIKSVVDPEKIEVYISNHTEPDHSGALLDILALMPKAKIYSSSPNGVKFLDAIFGKLQNEVVPVKTKDTLKIGKRELVFYQAPMVHWPDNMVTYDSYDKILYSNDIFGQHYATSNLFDYDNDINVLTKEVKKYYANIVLPYSRQANKILEAAKTLDIKTIATSHGVIWEKHIKDVYKLYEQMTTHHKEEMAVVVYNTMWGSTEKMAISITEAFRNKGIPVRLYNLENSDHSEILTDVMEAKYLALGSSTFNNSILPTTAAFLSYLKGLAPVNIKTIAFGSYGWGGQSVGIIEKEFLSMGFDLLVPSIKHLHRPDEEALNEMMKYIEDSL